MKNVRNRLMEDLKKAQKNEKLARLELEKLKRDSKVEDDVSVSLGKNLEKAKKDQIAQLTELQDAKIKKNNAAQKIEDTEKKLKTKNEEVRTLKTELTDVAKTMKKMDELKSELKSTFLEKLEAHTNDLNDKSDSRQKKQDQKLTTIQKEFAKLKIKSNVSYNEKKDSLSTLRFYKNRLKYRN